MMQVTSTVTIYTSNISMLIDLAKQAQVMTAEALHTEVVQAEVMPRDYGTLQNESTFVETSRVDQGVVSIVSSTPYARRLYFHPEYNFHRGEWFDAYGDSHGGNIAAGGEWFEPWINGSQQDFCPRTFAAIYRRLLGGLS